METKTINFQQGRNYFHTINEFNIQPDGGAMIKGEATITGFSINEINPGDELIINGKYTVVSCIRRDHQGIFDNPKDAINGFFEAKCTFTRVIQSK